MSNSRAVDDLPLVVEREAKPDAEAPLRRVGIDIVAGVLGALLVVVIAWAVLNMMGVLGDGAQDPGQPLPAEVNADT